MIGLFGIGLAGVLLVLMSGRALDAPPEANAPEGKPDSIPASQDGFLNALLFMLVLVGVIAHYRKRKQEDDE